MVENRIESENLAHVAALSTLQLLDPPKTTQLAMYINEIIYNFDHHQIFWKSWMEAERCSETKRF